VTLPKSAAQSAKTFLRRAHFRPLQTHPRTYSLPAPAQAPFVPQSTLPPALPSAASSPAEVVQERANDFASHSGDFATGGLKTLTAKRELPALPERRPNDHLQDTASVPRSYMFLLIIVVCALLMLISGGVILVLMLQP
jgi:hypothetical protein